ARGERRRTGRRRRGPGGLAMTEEHDTAAPANDSAAPAAAPVDVGATAPAGTSRRRTPLSLRELVLVVVLGVVCGFLYWVFVQAWNGLAIAMGPAGDLAQHLVFGSWLLVAPVAIAILRRPGVGILAEMLAAVIEVVFLGSPVGPLLLLSAALQGIGSALPFALTGDSRLGVRLVRLPG